MRMLIRLCMAGLLLLLGGCQTLSGLQSPEVNLSAIQLRQASLFEQQWQVVLRVRNPNDRDLTLKSVDYELFVNGKKLARGLTGEPVTLPAMGSALVPTQITTSLLQALSHLQTLQNNPDAALHYRIKGTARVAGVGFPLHFDHDGDVTLPAANMAQ